MQQQPHRGRRRLAACTVAFVLLGACAPYGPPIPGSAMPGPMPSPSPAWERAEPSRETDEPAEARVGPATVESGETKPPAASTPRPSPLALPERFRSRQDSLAWAEAVRRAKTDKRMRVVVSLDARTLWLLRGPDTLRVAPVAIGTEKRLVHGKQSWVFETPRGLRRVNGKAADPVWTPPLWHYVEMAQRYGLKLAVMPANGRVALPGGDRLEVRDSLVGRWNAKRGWRALPLEDEVVVDGTLYVPPVGTKNRIQHGQLGPYKLDTGDGYLIHGSPDASAIGRASTHGCIRLHDEDLEFLYRTVPVGTPVYIL